MTILERLKKEKVCSNLYYAVKRENPEADFESLIAICRTRQRKRHTFAGKPCKLVDIAKENQVSLSSIYQLTCKGMSVDDAVARLLSFAEQKQSWERYQLDGELASVKKIAKVTGVSPYTLKRKLQAGESVERSVLELKNSRLETGETLSQYCVRMKYNLSKIVCILEKGKASSLEEAIEVYLEEGQMSGNYQHMIGPVARKYFFLNYQLNPARANYLFRDGNDLNQVIAKLVLTQRSSDWSALTAKKIQAVYQVVEPLESFANQRELLDKISLTQEEKKLFWDRFARIKKIQREALFLGIYHDYVNASVEKRRQMNQQYRITEQESYHIITGELLQDYDESYTPGGRKVYIKQPR